MNRLGHIVTDDVDFVNVAGLHSLAGVRARVNVRRWSNLTFVLVATGVLHATIWPHEVGHSASAHLSGCQAN